MVTGSKTTAYYLLPAACKVKMTIKTNMGSSVKQTFKIRYHGKSAVATIAAGAASTYIW